MRGASFLIVMTELVIGLLVGSIQNELFEFVGLIFVSGCLGKELVQRVVQGLEEQVLGH
jgi:hypothetical protein